LIDPQLHDDHPEVLDGRHLIASYQVNVEFTTEPYAYELYHYD